MNLILNESKRFFVKAVLYNRYYLISFQQYSNEIKNLYSVSKRFFQQI